MLEHKMVHLLGSDVHRPQTIYPKIGECIKIMEKIVGNIQGYDVIYVPEKR